MVWMMPNRNTQSGQGRPPKFDEPSNSITITLPLRILRQLEEINSDRAKAIVKCVEIAAEMNENATSEFGLIPISEDSGVLIIGPCPSLESIPYVQLVEISPFRYLISVPSGTPISTLELSIMDLIESLPAESTNEKNTLVELRRFLSYHRRENQVISREVFLIGL